MIVCLCKGVSCSVVRRVLSEGAGSLEEIGQACGAGTDCGGCQAKLGDMLEDHAELHRRVLPLYADAAE